MAKDPICNMICNMEVDEETAEFESQYASQTYYFLLSKMPRTI